MLLCLQASDSFPCKLDDPVSIPCIGSRVKLIPSHQYSYIGTMLTHTKRTFKVPSAGSCRAVHRRLIVTAHDIERYRNLYSRMMSAQSTSTYKFPFSELSCLLLSNIPIFSYIPAILQCWTLCRYNELKQISIIDIINGNPLMIKSSKSTHVRSVPPLPFMRKYPLIGISPYTRILVISYDSYKQSLARAESKIGFRHSLNINDKTHIFRHLEASFMFAQGKPIREISDHLGHLHDVTTRLYIHEGLFTASTL